VIWNTVTSLFGRRRAARAPAKLIIPIDRPEIGGPVFPKRTLSASEVAASLPPRPAPPAAATVQAVVAPASAAPPASAADPEVIVPKESLAVTNQPPTPFPNTPPMPQRTAPPVVNAPHPLPQLPSQSGMPQAAPTPATQAAGQQLVVGRGIYVSGKITNCDRLVVEGDVRATLTESRGLEISAGGTFNGSAAIEEADIGGQFDGELHVRGRLSVRATGRIIGRIRYGSIEIQAGGEITGQIAVYGQEPPAAEAPRAPASPQARPESGAASPAAGDQQAQELLSRNFRGPRSRH
jgi:cytoskeletal protein CcmA (bactofilin family)